MSKITILFTLIFCFQLSSIGMESEPSAPDYKAIEKAIKKKKSVFYYPKLLKRFQEADTSLTLEDLRHLYYGYTFHKDYSPYGSSDYEDSLQDILRKDELVYQDYHKVKEYSLRVLEEKPFHLRSMNYLLFAADKLGDGETFKPAEFRYSSILKVIFSSGDGLKKNSAFYVIEVSHEYAMLGILGLHFGGQQSLIETFDYLKVAENEKAIEGVYFEISPLLNSMDDLFK